MLVQTTSTDLASTLNHLSTDSGININLWRCFANADEQQVQRSQWKGKADNFSIVFNLNPALLQLTRIKNNPQYYKATDPVMLLLPRDADLEFKTLDGHSKTLVELEVDSSFYNIKASQTPTQCCLVPPRCVALVESIIRLCEGKDIDSVELQRINSSLLQSTLSEFFYADEQRIAELN